MHSRVDIFTSPISVLAGAAVLVTASFARGADQNPDKPETLSRMPASEHQRELLDDFRRADVNRDGRLNADELVTLLERRSFVPSPHQADVIGAEDAAAEAAQRPDTKAKMPASPHQRDVLSDFARADMNTDGWVTFAEYIRVVVHERPGEFPPKGEVESAAVYVKDIDEVGDATVDYQPPFGPEALERAISKGGFKAVDADESGLVSVLEARDMSMLSLRDASIYDFADSDADRDGLLNKQEFNSFRQAIAKDVADAKASGHFPYGS